MALEEWRRWLERLEQLFLVWTNHKNLSYMQHTKRLNSRPARWQLFLKQFNFSISYHPGSRNTKPDTLSCQFSPESSSVEAKTILPASCMVGAVTWEIETAAQRSASRARSSTSAYVLACETCHHQAPPGLLHPLPVPSCPWSNIALDFVTGLPCSSNHSAILTIVDRFSKAAHFIPLSMLPFALETASLLVEHVVRLHGIPVDILSDRAPQFVSHTWRAFCSALAAGVSLSSGYHPQSNVYPRN